MEFEHSEDTEDRISLTAKDIYDEYYERVLLKEEPFYKEGISSSEIQKEIEYLNENLESFYNGTYRPLWKQNLDN